MKSRLVGNHPQATDSISWINFEAKGSEHWVRSLSFHRSELRFYSSPIPLGGHKTGRGWTLYQSSRPDVSATFSGE